MNGTHSGTAQGICAQHDRALALLCSIVPQPGPLAQRYQELVAEGTFRQVLLDMYRFGKLHGESHALVRSALASMLLLMQWLALEGSVWSACSDWACWCRLGRRADAWRAGRSLSLALPYGSMTQLDASSCVMDMPCARWSKHSCSCAQPAMRRDSLPAYVSLVNRCTKRAMSAQA